VGTAAANLGMSERKSVTSYSFPEVQCFKYMRGSVGVRGGKGQILSKEKKESKSTNRRTSYREASKQSIGKILFPYQVFEVHEQRGKAGSRSQLLAIGSRRKGGDEPRDTLGSASYRGERRLAMRGAVKGG